MAEEIQYLIDQIQKEGVEKAELEAEKIINEAKSEAEKIINEAKSEAEKSKSEAVDEAKSLKNKSITAIDQAARDLLITLGQSCEKVVLSTLDVSIKKELKHDYLKMLINKIIENQNESLSEFLRPELAKIVSEAINKD